MEVLGNTKKACHIVVIPYPGRGHINPMLTFCKQLLTSSSAKDYDLSFTIILTEEWLGLINLNDKPANSRIATIPNVVPSEHVRGSDNEGFLQAVYTRMEEPVERVLDELEGPPVRVIIADTVLPWVVGVGKRRGVPVASFWPLLACSLLPFYHFELFERNGHYPLDPLLADQGDERVDYILGIDSIRLGDRPLVLHSYKKRMLDLLLEAMSYLDKAQFIILRTLNEFEETSISAMQKILPSTIPIYPIGPAITLPLKLSPSHPTTDNESDIFSSCCDHEELDYIKWLNSHSEKSVLLVSLGSHLLPSRAQMEELTIGLADSRVPFLFVAREETLYLEGLCGKKGLLVNWCDQIKVLEHKSIGGFLTQAGLNSIIESAFAGIPMLTFPLSTDQPLASKLVVEDWKIGWRLRENVEKDVLVKRAKTAEVVRKFMDFGSVERKEMDRRCKEFMQVLWAAVGTDSAAECNVSKFLSDISAN